MAAYTPLGKYKTNTSYYYSPSVTTASSIATPQQTATNIASNVDPRIAQRAQTSSGAYIPTSTKVETPANNNGGGDAPVAPASSTPAVDPYASYYNKMVSLYEKQLAEERARQERVKQARIEAANTTYNTSVENLNNAKDSSLRQAYIKHMQEQKALPQQMQAYGISGGATETNLANMKNVYGTNRTNILNEAMAQQRMIEQDRANAIASAEGDAANYEASAIRDYNNGLLDVYASALNNKLSMNTSSAPTANIRNNQWYKMATSLLEEGNNRDEVIAYLDANGVDESIIDMILNDWDSSF